MSYNNISNLPSHGNSGDCGCGNARENYVLDRSGASGIATGNIASQTCAFPAHPQPRVSCMPAAYTSLDGLPYHRMRNAYGASRPSGHSM